MSHNQTGASPNRRDRLIPTVCPGCGAVYRRGNWRWERASPEARQHSCPACRRIADDYPAGLVALRGGLLQRNKAEILNLATREASKQGSQHALAA